MIEEQLKQSMIDEIGAVHPHHIAIAAIENDMDPNVFVAQCCMGVVAAARGHFEDMKVKEDVVYATGDATITVHFETEAEVSGTKKRPVSISA